MTDTWTCVGPLLDRDGMVLKTAHYPDRHGAWHTRHQRWATPSAGVRRRQASWIGVDVNHSHDWIGHVEHLELDKHERLWAVATLKNFDPDEYVAPLFFSPSLTFNERDGSDVEVTSVGIVAATAQIASLPVQFLRGAVDWRGCTSRWSGTELDGYRRDLCERAAEQHVLRRGRPIVVHSEHGLEPLAPGWGLDRDGEPIPYGPLRWTKPHRGILSVS